ncbi:MAG: WecB/TagA/CpsF family glycosyltransferase [Chloroflexota bacterium]
MRPRHDSDKVQLERVPAAPNAIKLLGVRIHRLRLSELLDRTLHIIRQRGRATILYANVHCLNIAFDDRAYRDILNAADLVYCDGTGVRLGAWLAGTSLPARMTGADWIHPLADVAVQNDLSLYLLGSEAGSASDAARVLQREHPGLSIVGAGSGYGLSGDDIHAINVAAPDLLLVGMGSPRQEKWIADHRSELAVPVVWAVGALFDFVSGRVPRGPRWMTEHGLEWACRLAVEPKKLWRRYLVGNPQFLLRIWRHHRPHLYD